MSYRQNFDTQKKSGEELADMLAKGVPPGAPIREAAEAELRLREHSAILRQAEAAEKSALAAERAATATIRYAKYTFWILVSTLLTFLVSFWNLWSRAPVQRVH